MAGQVHVLEVTMLNPPVRRTARWAAPSSSIMPYALAPVEDRTTSSALAYPVTVTYEDTRHGVRVQATTTLSGRDLFFGGVAVGALLTFFAVAAAQSRN